MAQLSNGTGTETRLIFMQQELQNGEKHLLIRLMIREDIFREPSQL